LFNPAKLFSFDVDSYVIHCHNNDSSEHRQVLIRLGAWCLLPSWKSVIPDGNVSSFIHQACALDEMR
jgi:hypothetical protein